MNYLDGIPAEVAELIEPYLDPAPETLASISAALVTKRDAAKAARAASGIEQIWTEAEEAYVGIDDANRAEWGDAKWIKPQAMNGPITTSQTVKSQSEYKSTVFLRLTARYVDAGTAKLTEILLPPDDKAFSLKETPIPDLIKAKGNNSQIVHDELGNIPLTRPAKPGEVTPAVQIPPTTGAAATAGALPAPAAAQPATAAAPAVGAVPAGAEGAAPAAPPPPRVPLTVADVAKEAIELARGKAKLAETRIWDWMVESCYTAEVRKVIFDAARLGTGVIKGPFPKVSEGVMVNATTQGSDDVDVAIKREIKPGVVWVDLWNCFPDPSCGENIHSGDHFFERDWMSTTQVRALKKLPGYIDKQIDLAIEQAEDATMVAGSANQTKTAPGADSSRKGRHEIWYFYGVMKRDEINCARVASGQKPLNKYDIPDSQKEVHAIVTMVDDIVVRAVLNPLDSGRFPYNAMPWQRRTGYWAGIGVAEQVRAPQRILNAAARAMLNNAGKSSGSQIVIDQASIKPANGNWAMEPDKIWYKTGDAAADDVRKAFYAFDIPNMTDEMLKIIEFAERQAESVSSIPLVTQGQSGKTTPDTFSGMQLQDNNANQLLRSIGYNFDDYITEPLVRGFYEWLLLDPKVPTEEKGDFKIDAHGSVALVERAIQDMTLASLGSVVLNPAFGVSPRKWMTEYLKSRRLVPQNIQYSEEEQQKIDSTPPPEPPQVQAAKILAASRTQIAQGALGLDQQAAQADAQLSADELALRREEMQAKRELAMLDYANKNNMTLTQAKTELAKVAMTLQAQRELAAADKGVALHMHHNKGADDAEDDIITRGQPRHSSPSVPASGPAKPIAQLPGRAADGEAFTQDNTEDN